MCMCLCTCGARADGDSVGDWLPGKSERMGWHPERQPPHSVPGSLGPLISYPSPGSLLGPHSQSRGSGDHHAFCFQNFNYFRLHVGIVQGVSCCACLIPLVSVHQTHPVSQMADFLPPEAEQPSLACTVTRGGIHTYAACVHAQKHACVCRQGVSDLPALLHPLESVLLRSAKLT